MRQDPYAKERAEARKKKVEGTSAVEQFFGTIMQQAKGENGKTPVFGVDFLTPAEMEAIKVEIIDRIPKAKDGEDADYDLVLKYIVEEVEKTVKSEVSKLPKPKDGKPGKDAVVDIPSIVESLLKAMPKMDTKGDSVDYLGIKDYIDKQVSKIKVQAPLMRNGGTNSLRQLTDVVLDGLSTDSKGNYILGAGGATTLDELTDVNTPTPSANDVLTWDGAEWIATPPPGAGGGEANTITNVGVGGVGLYKTKVGVDLKLKNINAGSSNVTITDDTGNDEVDIDLSAAAKTSLGKADTASQPGHTHTASEVTDFDTEVANNSAVAANTAKVTNATHTGEVTGSGALTVDKTAITNKTLVTAASGDHVLIADASDTDNLKKVNVSDFLDGAGDLLAANNLSDLADAATARTNLGVDAAGTDNSTDVTLAGTGTYISIAGQVITVDPITESDISDLGAYITGITGSPLSDLSDVTITTIASGEILKWNGSAWINQTLAEAGIAPALGVDDNYVTDAEKVVIGNTSGTNTGDEPSASTTVAGIVELATTAEVTTGTDTTRAITPDALTGADVNIAKITYDTADGEVTALGNLGATETIDFSNGIHQTGTLDSNVTITHSNEVSGRKITLYFSYSGAQRTITWSDVDVWLDNATGAAPAAPITTGDEMVVTLQFIGTTCYASATGNYAVYA